MLIQWCLKGVAESSAFTHSQAKAAVTSDGLTSTWLRNPTRAGIPTLPQDSHFSLSQAVLDAHVNAFSSAAGNTPYLSLSAGCVELDPSKATTIVYPALETALDFATKSGTCAGFVFSLWVLVSPKPAPELPGFAEEVRELNLFKQFGIFHHEGEIAAKLFVPARQIELFKKYDKDLTEIDSFLNPTFVPPERISNVLELL
jgi:hypothetical protein